ncbi:ABC transporter ATP-binding protein [Sphingomonas sp. LY29]|uniref:ABC transporter ATP-binding protein n=1 Tax=Sphingomonas sp. LY29 TaxID=3095341 RepID=UPI002D796191|nr:ABC transporter ATP-binding protein [Sphingomonas sp. LY29]WRP26145.1 ABC transporter ATP-binding protein [Sphingomonas sp. LY29]
MTSLIASQVGIEGRLSATDLLAQSGEMIALVGPNGGGKTSLLRGLARVEDAVGTVEIDGEDVDQTSVRRRQQLLSYLSASRDLTWPISTRDVIALGQPTPDPGRVDVMLEQFELLPMAKRGADTLSTGERARVLLARALAAQSSVLLLDEPLSNLDPYWVLRTLEIIADAAANKQTLLVAIHDLSHLDRFDRALLVADGKVQMDETPADLLASERFEEAFRVQQTGGRFGIRPEDQRSLR